MFLFEANNQNENLKYIHKLLMKQFVITEYFYSNILKHSNQELLIEMYSIQACTVGEPPCHLLHIKADLK